MLNPPRITKFKKTRKGKLAKYKFKTNYLTFGTIGLKTIESGIINLRQIESARQAITRKIKRKGKVWIKISPNISITSKPIGTRMGKGKGQISYWATKVRGGTILFELTGVSIDIALKALKTGGAKLPVKTKIFT